MTFYEQVWFRQAVFLEAGHFGCSFFRDEADFVAVSSHSVFDIERTHFEYLPNFIQAHFEEVPRLDDLEVVGRLISPHHRPERSAPKNRWQGFWWGVRYAGGRLRTWPMRAAKGIWHRLSSADRDTPPRWRALKRLAIHGHDTDSELEFHAREMRAQRFVGDWPLPPSFWRRKAWGGFFRFWFGILYEVASDFGRSLFRPFAAWALCIAIFAAYFLGQSPDMEDARRKLNHQGFFGQVVAHSTTAWKALSGELPTACVSKTLPTGDADRDSQYGVTGLAEPVRKSTNLVSEALSVAYHNAVIVLDSSGDSMHRAYGCLYGVERYGGNPVAYVPRAVAIASGVQRLLSAILVFLFGLALRNMLKVK